MPAFLADECFPGHLNAALRDAGFDVLRSRDELPAADDRLELALAVEQNRVLLTEDADLGDLVVRFRIPSTGVVRVDLKSIGRENQARRLRAALRELGERTSNCLVSIEPSRSRVRRLD